MARTLIREIPKPSAVPPNAVTPGEWTAEKAKIAAVNPPTSTNPGKAWIQGPSSPKFDDMETVIYDHVMERSATPATNRVNMQTLLGRLAPSGSGKQVRLFIPPRWDGSDEPDPIVVDRAGSDAWAVRLPSGVSLEGAGRGSAIKLAPDQPNFTRMLKIHEDSHVGVRRLRLDGNRANQDTWEQNHNIGLYDATDVVIEDVESVEAMGDAINMGSSLGNLTERVWINRCTLTDIARNPVTINEACDVWITDSYLHCSIPTGQAIDSEPNAEQDYWGLYVSGCILSHAVDNAVVYAAALGGVPGHPRRLTRIIGNEFRNGGLWLRFLKDAVIQGNTGNPCRVDGMRYSEHVQILGNIWDFGGVTDRCMEFGFSTGETPRNWTIANNHLRSLGGTLVYAWSTEGVTVTGNVMDQGGTGSDAQIILRTNGDTSVLKDVLVSNNRMGNGYRGIELMDHATSISTNIAITNNQFHDLSSNWFRGNGVTKFDNLMIAGNLQRDTGAIREPGVPYRISGNAWSCSGTPESVIAAPIGAQAFRRDGGAGTTMYIKESGTGTSGWVAK